MNKLFRKAMEIAKRDPDRTVEFLSDVLIVLGLLALVYIAWLSCHGEMV